jgi:hypothetical protein
MGEQAPRAVREPSFGGADPAAKPPAASPNEPAAKPYIRSQAHLEP